MGKKRKIATALKRVFTLALALMLTCSNLGNIRLFAAESHKLTVTGGTEGTDYKWDGKTLKVLTETSLTISGNNEETGWLFYSPDPEEVIEINSGITSNITLSDATIYSNNDNSPIKVDSNATLNLTLQGTNTMNPQNGDEDGYPSIWVPQGANLVITKDSTGSLAASSYNGSAVIGGRTQDTENNCGNITINGGTLNLNAGSNAFYDSGAAIGSGKKSSFNSDIVINGGNITAKSSEGAAIGCGAYPDTKNKSDGTVTVNGGNIVAASGSSSDGIGVHKGRYKYDVKVTIAGGNVSSTANYVRPVNGNVSVYKTEINIGAGISVSSLTVSINGTAYSYGMNDVTADSDGNIYAWLPNGAIVTGAAAVSGTDTVEYTGSINVNKNDKNTGSLIEKGTAGDFKIISCDSSCTYSYDKTSKVLTLSGSGNIEITLKSNVKVTDNRIVYAKDAAVNLTINNVIIETADSVPIYVKGNAKECGLTLKGTSTFNTSISHGNKKYSNNGYLATIYKESGNSTLTFDGDGTLNINNSSCCDGIGGDDGSQGIIFNGGTININTVEYSSAIGFCTGWDVNSKDIVVKISGGKISAAGGGQGIGSKKGKVYISGGTIYASGNNQGIVNGYQYVVIDGGSINMGKQNNYFRDYKYPKNSSGNFVYLTEIQMGEDSTLAKNAKIDSIKITTSLRYTYNLKDVYTDNNGLLYFYLPEGTNITEVETEDAVYSGTITTNSTINNKPKCEYTIGTAFAVFNYAGAKSSMNLKTTDYTATYGDTVTIPVTFTGTKPEGMVVLAKDENGTVKIGSADVSSSTASLTIDTNKKELNIGDNSLYVIYTTKAGKTFSNEIKVTLNAKELTLNPVAVNDKNYDGNCSMEIDTKKTVLNGVINSDNVKIDASEVIAYVSDPDVERDSNGEVSEKEVTYTGKFKITDDNNDGNDDTVWYALVQPENLSGKILPLELTVKADDIEVTQDDAMPETDTVTYGGFLDEENEKMLDGVLQFTFNPESTANADENGSVTPSGLSSPNYNITYEPGKFTIKENPDPKMSLDSSEITVTYGSKLIVTVYTEKNTEGTVSLLNSDKEEIANAQISNRTATISYDTSNKGIPIGMHEMSVVYTDKDGNEYSEGLYVTVEKKELDVNVTCSDKIYDGNCDIEVSPSLSGIVNVNGTADDVEIGNIENVTAETSDANVEQDSDGNIIPKNVYLSDDYVLDGDASEWYEINQPVNLSAKILKKDVTVKAIDVTVNLNDEMPELGASDVTAEGLINGKSVYDLNSENLQFDFNPADTKKACDDGSVTPKGLTSVNYQITFKAGRFTVIDPDPKMSVASEYTVEYTDKLGIKVTFEKNATGTVVLKNGNDQLDIASINDEKSAELTYDTLSKYLEIGENNLTVLFTDNANNEYSKEIKITVTQHELTADVKCLNKTYDGSSEVNVDSADLIGAAESDDVYLAEYGSVTGTAEDASAGTKNVSFDDDAFVLDGNDCGWYTLKKPVSNVTIKKADLYVTLNSDVQVNIGDSLPELNEADLSFNGFVSSEGIENLNMKHLSFEFNPASTAEACTGTVTPKGITGNNYNVIFTSVSFIVNDPDPGMGLDADSVNVTYPDKAEIIVNFAENVSGNVSLYVDGEFYTNASISSDSNGISTAALTVDSSNKILSVGEHTGKVTYADSDNRKYEKDVTITVSAKDVTVNFSCADKVYDGNSQIEITGEKIEGVIDADSEGVSINEVTASTLDPDVLMGENAAAAKTVILSDDVILTGSEAEWYTLNGITGLTAKITKKPITVKAGDVSVELNSEMPVSDSVTISGLVTDEDGTEISDLTGTLAFTFNPDTTGEATDAGSVTANGYLSNNYEISYESGVFTVTDPDPVMNVNGSYDVTYSDQLNIPVTFSKNATGIVKLFDEKDDIIAQADISSNAATLVYNTAEKKLNIGTHELTVYYMDSKDRTYTKNVKVTIAAKGISVNVSYVSRTYNGYKSVEIESAVLDTNDIVTVNSVVDDVTLSDYSAVTATLPSASAGKCTPAINGTFSITGNDAGFYKLSGINSSSADIEKAPLKVSILNGVSVEQGAALPELTINDVTFEGFISYSDGSGSMINEGVSDLNGTLGFTFNPASTENAVTDGTVTPNGYTSNNYDIEYVGAEFIVTEKQEEPTEAPTAAPTEAPAEEPTAAPTETPAEEPTETPAEEPTAAPTETPAEEPTAAPTETPASEPTVAPTQEPTQIPTAAPTQVPVIIYPDITTIAPTTIAPTTASSTTVESTTVSLTSVPENTTSITTVTVLTEATTETSSTKVSTIDIPDEDNPMGKDDIDADSQPESTADNENPADIEITQEQNPQGSVKLPATGTAPASVYFVSGSVLLALGAFAILLANRRKEEKEDKE